MTEQFRRIARVTAYRSPPVKTSGFIYDLFRRFEDPTNGIEITEEFAIEAEIEKTSENKPNTCKIKIANLAESTRVNLARLPLTVHLEAGYDGVDHDGEYRHMFVGDLVRGFSELKGPTWITTLQLGDGSRAHRFARVNRSYKRGTTVMTALKDAAVSLGFDLPPNVIASPELQQQFATGVSLFGPARDEMSKLLAPFGYSFSIQNGKPTILRDEEVLDNQAIVVDNKSWLLGSPEYQTPEKPSKPAMCKFDSMLYPEIDPGKKIALKSRAIDGTFKAIKVRHSMRTEGGDWKTTVEARVL